MAVDLESMLRQVIAAHVEANERALLDGLTYPVPLPEGADPVRALREAYALNDKTVTVVLHPLVPPANVRIFEPIDQHGAPFLLMEPGTARRIETALTGAGYAVNHWQEGGTHQPPTLPGPRG